MHDFPLIILIFLVVSYPKETATFSITPIGKLVAVCLIFFYTAINELYGLVVCSILILYYQSDYVENIDHLVSVPHVSPSANQSNLILTPSPNQPKFGMGSGLSPSNIAISPLSNKLINSGYRSTEYFSSITDLANDLSENISRIFAPFKKGDPSLFEYITPFQDKYNDIIQNAKQGKNELMQFFKNSIGDNSYMVELSSYSPITW